jgi:hypothetical protein
VVIIVITALISTLITVIGDNEWLASP